MFKWIGSDASQFLQLFNCVQKNELRPNLKLFQQNMFKNHMYLMYMFKDDLALNNLKMLPCHKANPINFYAASKIDFDWF